MADRPLIPATEALLDGWSGPIVAAEGDGAPDDKWVVLDGAWFFCLASGALVDNDCVTPSLDPARREAAHRVVDVAREVYGADLSALLDQPAALAEAWRGLVGGERG